VAALCKAGVDSSAIASIRIDTYDAALNYPGCAHKGPFRTPLQAKMSIAFGVAAALAAGEIAEANYSRLDDAEIHRLIGLTAFRIDAALNAAFPRRQGTRVTLEFDDGRSVTHAMDDIAFADANLIETRFRATASAMLGEERTAAVVADIANLDELVDVARIVHACAATPPISSSA
jgi:2-methylcitrate dehydratase PrpD